MFEGRALLLVINGRESVKGKGVVVQKGWPKITERDQISIFVGVISLSLTAGDSKSIIILIRMKSLIDQLTDEEKDLCRAIRKLDEKSDTEVCYRLLGNILEDKLKNAKIYYRNANDKVAVSVSLSKDVSGKEEIEKEYNEIIRLLHTTLNLLQQLEKGDYISFEDSEFQKFRELDFGGEYEMLCPKEGGKEITDPTIIDLMKKYLPKCISVNPVFRDERGF